MTAHMVTQMVKITVDAWRHRRTEEGGVADDTALLGLLLGAAVAVGLAIVAGMNNWIANFDFGI